MVSQAHGKLTLTKMQQLYCGESWEAMAADVHAWGSLPSTKISPVMGVFC